METEKKWKADVATLTHSKERVASLSGRSHQAVAYAPDIGAVSIGKSVSQIAEDRKARELEHMYDQLSRSTAIGTLIVRCGGSLPTQKRLLQEYRESLKATT